MSISSSDKEPGWYITDGTHEQQHTQRLYCHLCRDRQGIIPILCVTQYKKVWITDVLLVLLKLEIPSMI